MAKKKPSVRPSRNRAPRTDWERARDRRAFVAGVESRGRPESPGDLHALKVTGADALRLRCFYAAGRETVRREPSAAEVEEDFVVAERIVDQADVDVADFDEADFDAADLDDAELDDADLDEADFDGCDQ